MQLEGGRNSFILSKELMCIILLVVAIVLTYGHTLDVPWYYDDFHNIVDNPALRKINFEQFWHSRGLVNITFSLNYAIHGLNLPGYHLVNILFHLLTSLFVFLVAKRIFKDSPWWACCVALLFALHPLQTQAVTYVVQRMATMAGLFFFLSLYLYVRGRERAGLHRSGWPFWIGAWLCGALAVLCKENAATLPAAIVLFELFYSDGRRCPLSKKILYVLPFALVPLWIAAQKIGLPVFSGGSMQQVGNFETVQAAEKVAPLRYFVTELPVLWHYLRMLVAPWGQALDYGYPFATSLVNVKSVLSGFGLVILLGVSWWYRKQLPWLLFGISWILLTLSVESTFIPLDPVYEHRLYIPMFGFAVLIISFLRDGFPWGTKHAHVLTLVYLCVLALLAFHRNEVWRDPVRLWESNAQQVVTGYRPFMLLADAYYEKGQLEKARETYRESIRRAEEVHVATLGAKFLLNLCVAAERVDDFSRAESFCGMAALKQPRNALTYYNLGVVQYRAGKQREALRTFDRSRELRPALAEAHYNFASIAYEMGDPSKVQAVLPILMRLDPVLARRLVLDVGAASAVGSRSGSEDNIGEQ